MKLLSYVYMSIMKLISLYRNYCMRKFINVLIKGTSVNCLNTKNLDAFT